MKQDHFGFIEPKQPVVISNIFKLFKSNISTSWAKEKKEEAEDEEQKRLSIKTWISHMHWFINLIIWGSIILLHPFI